MANLTRAAKHRQAKSSWPVVVAMAAFNGWARPLGRQVLLRGSRLFNINNFNLARDQKIFPAPAKTDPIDARRMLALSVAHAATDRA